MRENDTGQGKVQVGLQQNCKQAFSHSYTVYIYFFPLQITSFLRTSFQKEEFLSCVWFYIISRWNVVCRLDRVVCDYSYWNVV